MRIPDHRAHRTLSLRAFPARQWNSRFTLISLLILGSGLLVLGHNGNQAVEKMRSSANDALAFVSGVAAAPVNAARDAKLWVEELVTLRDQNRVLKSQVAQLMQWQAVATNLQAENDALQRLIHVMPEGKMRFSAARIVGASGGPYMRSALINGGSTNGIVSGQAVISAEGLLGRVIEVGDSSSRVLLLTDINSRVPVISEHSRERSIAAGDNSTALKLDYVETATHMKVGERLLTSGDGGIFPPGVPVGVITAIEDGVVSMQPLVDWGRTEYVSVVDYEF